MSSLLIACVCSLAAQLVIPPDDPDIETFASVVDELEVRDFKTGKRVDVAAPGTIFHHDKKWKAGVYSSWFQRRNLTVDATALRPIEEAKAIFDRQLETKETAVDRVARATILYEQRKYDAAIADLDRALAITPDLYAALCLRADCRDGLMFAERDPRRFWALREKALADAERTVALRPDDFRGYMSRAMILSKTDGAAAIDDFTTIARLAPHYAPAFSNRAKLLVDLGRVDEAFTDLNHALELDPEYSDAYTNRGIIFHNRKQFDRAIADATDAIKFNRQNVSAWNNRAIGYRETKQYERSLADFSEYVKILPANSDGYHGRAETYLAMGKDERASKGPVAGNTLFEKALAECELALARQERDYACRKTKGTVLGELKRWKDVVRTCDETITLMREDTNINVYPAWKEIERILDSPDPLLATPSDFPWRNVVAECIGQRVGAYRMLRDAGDDASGGKLGEDLERLVLLQPEKAEHWRSRGLHHVEPGRFADAYRDLNEALTRSPDDIEALRGFVRAATGTKRYDDAWYAVGRLKELKSPLSDDELAELRRESGRKE